MKHSVRPVSYDLEFEPNFKKFTFSGRSKIVVKCSVSTSKIVMNCAELQILSCKVYEGKKPVKCTRYLKTNAKYSKIDLIISLGITSIHLVLIN